MDEQRKRVLLAERQRRQWILFKAYQATRATGRFMDAYIKDFEGEPTKAAGDRGPARTKELAQHKRKEHGLT